MTDTEILTRLAKAMGYEIYDDEDDHPWPYLYRVGDNDLFLITIDGSRPWNPLADAGLAFEIAVKLCEERCVSIVAFPPPSCKHGWIVDLWEGLRRHTNGHPGSKPISRAICLALVDMLEGEE